MKICELCEGRGERLIAWPPGSMATMKECSDCEGSGRLNNDETPYNGPDNTPALEALKLERGCTYAIEVQDYMSHENMVSLKDQLKYAADDLGITLIVLVKNLRIARDDRKVVTCE